MTNSSKVKNIFVKAISAVMAAAIFASFSAEAVFAANTGKTVASSSASQSATLGQVVMKPEQRYSNDLTHPFNKQTNTIRVRWNAVENAERYQIYIKGGEYSKWTKIKTVLASKKSYAVKNLARNTTYAFKVRAIATGVAGEFSEVQRIKTARIDYDSEGWQAMCRIVYHEVGKINDSMWDAPIVYVSDCVVNRYEAAKYLNDKTWSSFYKRYDSVQSMIYQSGGFMSDSGLARDGAAYTNCTDKVKLAVYGALYNKTTVSSIKNDSDVFYWCNTSYKPSSGKVAYTYKIPWGYFSIWRDYWG